MFPLLLISCKGPVTTDISEEKNRHDSLIDSQKDLQKTTPQQEKIPNDNLVPLFYPGQLCHWIRGIYEDSKGNLWFGTNHYGVMRYNGRILQYFTEKEGFGGNRVSGIAEDDEGNLWFGTTGGLTKFNGESFEIYSEKEGLLDNWISTMTLDSKGQIWVGTMDGLNIFDGSSFETLAIPKPQIEKPEPILSHNRITSILEDKNGIMWIGTDGYGICKYDGQEFTHITTENGLADNNIAQIWQDSQGDVWVGTMFGGVSHFTNDAVTNYHAVGIIKLVEAVGFYEDRAGNIWFAVEGDCIYRFDGKNFVNYNEDD
ncbi:MAG: hypothetical protein HKN48_10345, partial [Flavobacteriaceae bacterium]|nr:hypothetical protein [Flavobacteriaceae bacterium]